MHHSAIEVINPQFNEGWPSINLTSNSCYLRQLHALQVHILQVHWLFSTRAISPFSEDK